jgi:hypothetical protein
MKQMSIDFKKVSPDKAKFFLQESDRLLAPWKSKTDRRAALKKEQKAA